MGKKLDGRLLANQLQEKLKQEVSEWKLKGQRLPKLVVILIGEDVGSQVYVRNKEAAAKKIGFHSQVDRLPETTSEEELLKRITQYNEDQQIDGILVQLPLPKHIDEERVLLAIDASKDVDGFHPLNMGKLFIGQPDKLPCTPYGIMELLRANDIEIAGKNAVIIGRSNIVGKPMAQLLLMADATVTITHSRTKNLKNITQNADIIVVAIGQAEFLTADYIKEGAVVIDVGMNRHENGHLVGDVNFENVSPKASYITPVPGGVGPMTITMLMEQTVNNARIK
ncbi:bifunctional methylenetetrahydrofolate dehydrogenase/methenyltetrahydrofolate cyclohydrolase [Vagococcus carniphilus]|uniref:Bifunctional protein FolD n=1 Tax=Vagococcus carniphilus TaxID=218144 RepID=A0AAW8UD06_9ENTE|nr:bifunctional methylenetetrahydrofolate dehydrogenase/methenyltetrahydrofolate cyclohydrolase [Vagococcus carniphilus]MDT2813875.1 bifunctional methylenetetrahydrofolate dehydrogenase/methenyltetrahydrofolate cyclohydrolase [Vagococcus carniphilus]MDT2829878.1 bifunctional methylenetetrahydrofolate dehydrogenase/methenyltetrahydrofolate cyclohydrolase [Vagococcus carniphilus]MDT2834865.1 bifunctional methylenetetrahydrofolate dehydrogenase/methenyltetrahydrofolate cyclohydrolase [Vagococcus ca